MTDGGWRKSSFSSGPENNCVEIRWRKSSYSTQNTEGDCVEVRLDQRLAGIRDSKNPAGPALALDPSSFSAFIAALTAD